MSDHWKVKHVCQEFDDDKETSLIFGNSEKGLSLIKSIDNQIRYKELSVEDALYDNPAMTKASYCTSNRQFAMVQLGPLSFIKLYYIVCITLWRGKYRRLKLIIKAK